MLSYLHAFHAGNHADILKHVVLLHILDALTRKDKPLRYIETHAGAGGYDLRSPAAHRNREHERGIGRLWQAADAPAPVARLLELVRAYNAAQSVPGRYPGSPWLARQCLRRDDSAYLFELHPAEHRHLVRDCGGDRRVTVLHEDGLGGCIGLVPPPEKRGLLFIDPSYEVKDEHRRVVDALVKAHRRFATGVYALWYPVIERRWVERFERAVRSTGIAPLELHELSVARDGFGRGLTGSGMLIVNPPWKLRDAMRTVLPWLARMLGVDGGGNHRIVGDPDT
jgi:23S rRNA (adenine2030-N6)-methyltransferase